jgi:signal transduction histidine kinase
MIALASVATATEPLTTLAEVRGLADEQADRNLPVEVVGTVIYFDPKVRNIGAPEGLILHDGTAGCYASSPLPFAGREQIRPGTRIRVTGTTNPRSYFPNIKDASVKVLGQAELPAPRPLGSRDLFSHTADSDWVEIEATVVGVEPHGLAFTVVLEIDGRIFKAEIPETPDIRQRAAGLMQRRVRLQGVVGTISNNTLQLTGRHFFVPSIDHLIPLQGSLDASNAPILDIASLLQSSHNIEELVRVRGRITQSGDSGFYMRDESNSAYVQAAEAAEYAPGSIVEVEGFAAVAPFRPFLRAARIQRTGEAPLPAPARLDPAKGIEIGLHNELVAVDCTFVALLLGVEGNVLQCSAGGTVFEARLPAANSLAKSLQAGDTLRLTGIYEVLTSRPMPRIEWADGFRMHLARDGGIHILAKAPWWTPKRVFLAFGLAMVALCIVLIWSWQLRRRVAAQSAIISRQIEQATIKDERERIARDLHDTLEQDLTGLSMQLGNLAPALDGDRELARQRLSLARGMLQHCRSEARASVSDLRNPHLLRRDLPEAMRESLPAVAAGAAAAFHVESHGTPQPLRATTQNHLLRIAREAVFNATRHASPGKISVHLTYDAEGVTLEIIDDGTGFDVTRKPPAGHFGVVGMRERANKIHAEFSIESPPGNGTNVRVRLPWSSPVARPRSRS